MTVDEAFIRKRIIIIFQQFAEPFFSWAVSEVDSTTTEERKYWEENRVKAEIPVLQTVKKNYAQTLDYSTYRLANELSK